VNETAPQPSRREFARTIAGLAATPLAASLAAADTPAESSAAVATALTEIARARFGKLLSEEDVKHIRRSIQREQYGAGLLKQVKLLNSDEPAMIFRADVP
jgi:hypothetical protein